MATVMNTATTDVSETATHPKEPSDMTADEVIAKIDELVNVANYLKRVAKPMVRRYGKKRAKTSNTDTVSTASTKRNGFAVPVTMADTLVAFLNANDGTAYTTESVVARTDVTAAMTRYIKNKDLQVPENRKNFTMDAALSAVFGAEEGTVSNWFEMQKHLTKVITSVTKKRVADPEEATTATAEEATTSEAVATTEPPAATAATKTAAPAKRIKRPSA